MIQIEAIKEMQSMGLGKQEISKKLSVDRKTVSKYIKKEEFSEGSIRGNVGVSRLDRWKEVIDGWLEEDRLMRFKQRQQQWDRDEIKDKHIDKIEGDFMDWEMLVMEKKELLLSLSKLKVHKIGNFVSSTK